MIWPQLQLQHYSNPTPCCLSSLLLCHILQHAPPTICHPLLLCCTGTGKTSTIVHAIQALVSSGASVLVAAYTNSALDNILLKLAGAGVTDFLRLGRASSCHPQLQEYMPGGGR